MQLAHITVKHGGKHHSAVRRLYVSVAEIVVLRKIHGDDAIEPLDIRYAGVRPKGFDEMDHLLKLYGKKDETKDMVERLFPGAVPVFPTKLADIGIINVGEPEDGADEPVYDPEIEKQERLDRRQELKDAAERKDALVEAARQAPDGSELIRPPAQQQRRRGTANASVLG